MKNEREIMNERIKQIEKRYDIDYQEVYKPNEIEKEIHRDLILFFNEDYSYLDFISLLEYIKRNRKRINNTNFKFFEIFIYELNSQNSIDEIDEKKNEEMIREYLS